MCKFCNYSEDNAADEDIINKRIRIGEIPDALGMEIYVNEDYDGKPYLFGNLFIPCGGGEYLGNINRNKILSNVRKKIITT